MAKKEKMIPFGILNLESDQLYVCYGTSCKTSDFVCDALEWWWDQVNAANEGVEELVIYADNSPENSSQRTQFLFRMVAFSKRTGLTIRLVYYPPYHSKYNPIERSWSFLENHWNGTLLDKIFTVLEWTKSMTWKCLNPVVHLLDKAYERGIRLNKDNLLAIQPYLNRHSELKKWDVIITPKPYSVLS